MKPRDYKLTKFKLGDRVVFTRNNFCDEKDGDLEEYGYIRPSALKGDTGVIVDIDDQWFEEDGVVVFDIRLDEDLPQSGDRNGYVFVTGFCHPLDGESNFDFTLPLPPSSPKRPLCKPYLWRDVM